MKIAVGSLIHTGIRWHLFWRCLLPVTFFQADHLPPKKSFTSSWLHLLKTRITREMQFPWHSSRDLIFHCPRLKTALAKVLKKRILTGHKVVMNLIAGDWFFMREDFSLQVRSTGASHESHAPWWRREIFLATPVKGFDYGFKATKNP